MRATGWVAGGFFLARTPLLPESTFWELAREGLAGTAALREPCVREALGLASPAALGALATTEADGGAPDAGLARTLVRYLVRMSTRCTPLGLMAGVSWGHIAPGASRVRLAARPTYRRLVRGDVAEARLTAEATVIEMDATEIAQLAFTREPSLRVVGGTARFTHLHAAGPSAELVEVAADEPVRVVLDRLGTGATGADLAAALRRAGLTDDEEEGLDFVRALACEGLLVSSLHPHVTRIGDLRADEAGAVIGRRVDPGPGAVLDAVDRSPLSFVPTAGQGRPWFETARLVSDPVVDLWKPADEAFLGMAELQPLSDVLDVLERLSTWSPDPALEAFTREFVDRYGEQWELDTLPLGERSGVPLLEVLDPESGIAFGGGTETDLAPVIDALDFPSAEPRPGPRPCDPVLLDGVVRTAAAGRLTWTLEGDSLRDLTSGDPTEFPDSVGLTVSRCLVDGESRWVVRYVSGPGALARVARFTGEDEALLREARRFLSDEERGHPDAVLVDVVHQPPGRAGNLAVHPRLRPRQVEGAGLSADVEDPYALDNLRVTMRAGELTLFSAVTGERVLARLPSTYNWQISPQPIVRFLGALQHGRSNRDLGWSWGNLETSPFLPRVMVGDVVVAPARWRLSREDLRGLVGATTTQERLAEAAALRTERSLPRVVGLTRDDMVLPVDLESPCLVDLLSAEAEREDGVSVTEVYLDPDGSGLVQGPEGPFAHELVIPFLRPRSTSTRVAQVDELAAGRDRGERGRASRTPERAPAASPVVFPPGSRWLSTEIRCGTSDADRVIAAVGAGLRDWGVRRWFFVRYDVPSWHVRVRIEGAPEHLLSDVVPRLGALLDGAPLVERTRGWAVETYRPEVERYGGAAGLDVCHDVFGVDSDAFVRLLDTPALRDPSLRWTVALRAAHDLLDATGLADADQLVLVEAARDRFRWEHQVDAGFVRAVGLQYRRDRDDVEAALAPLWSRAARPDSGDPADGHVGPEPAGGVASVLRARREALEIVARRLEALAQDGALNRPVSGIAPSLLHMTFNRYLVSDHRAQETVLYDYMARALRSRIARAGSGSTRG